jgi:hypothetical protein
MQEAFWNIYLLLKEIYRAYGCLYNCYFYKGNKERIGYYGWGLQKEGTGDFSLIGDLDL